MSPGSRRVFRLVAWDAARDPMSSASGREFDTEGWLEQQVFWASRRGDGWAIPPYQSVGIVVDRISSIMAITSSRVMFRMHAWFDLQSENFGM